ncbi:MAG: hypothetical protein IPI19_16015 [Ignavibacteriales bacterium]|nr:hypothetical protein [Ignavibacteriales bacterium]
MLKLNNAIWVQATKHSVNIVGSTAYITNMSCTTCAKVNYCGRNKTLLSFQIFGIHLQQQFHSLTEVEVVKMDMPSKEIQYDLMNYSSAKKTEKSN